METCTSWHFCGIIHDPSGRLRWLLQKASLLLTSDLFIVGLGFGNPLQNQGMLVVNRDNKCDFYFAKLGLNPHFKMDWSHNDNVSAEVLMHLNVLVQYRNANQCKHVVIAH